jgi:translocation and assembly module TamB
MRIFLRSGIWILFVLFILLILLGLFVSTDSGTKLLAKMVQGFSKDITIEGVKGSVIRQLEIQKFEWQDAEQKVHIEGIRLQNNLSSLLSRRLELDNLEIARLQLDLPAEQLQNSTALKVVLPLGIRIKNLKIEQLIINKGKNSQIINNIQLSAHSEGGDRLMVSSFSAQALLNKLPAEIHLTGETQLSSPHKSDIKATLKYSDPIQGQFDSQFTLQGDLDKYHIKGQAELHSKTQGLGLFDLLATGSSDDLTIKNLDIKAFEGTANAVGSVSWQDAFKWNLELKADQLNLRSFSATLPQKLNTRFKTQGRWKDKQANGVIDLQALSGQINAIPFSARGKIRLIGDQANIDQLQVNALEGIAKVSGKVTWKQNLAWNLQLKTEHIQLNKVLAELPSTFSSQLKTQGSIKTLSNKTNKLPANAKSNSTENYFIDAVISLQKLDGILQDYPLKAKGNISIKGKRNNLVARLDQVQINALDGVIKSAGTVTQINQNQLQWDVKLDTKQLKTQRILPDWPAVLNLKLTSTGKHNFAIRTNKANSTAKTNAFVNLQSLSGTLQSYPLAGQGKLYLNGQVLRVEKLQLSSGRNTLFVDGQASEPFNLQWKVKGQKLSQLYRGLGGSLNGEGILKGTLEQPQIQAKLQGKSLAFGANSLAAINLSIAQKRNQYSLDAKLQQLKVAQQSIKSMRVEGQGSLDKHRIAIRLQHPEANLALNSTGAWKNKQWQGQLKQLTIDKTVAGDWQLTKAVPITLSAEKITTGKLCLKNKTALACSSNRWQAQSGLALQGNLTNIPLALAKPWLGENISFSNKAKANADFSLKQSAGKVKLRFSDSQMTLRSKGMKTQVLNYQAASLDAVLNGTRLQSDFSASILKRGTIKGNVTLSNLDKANKRAVQGQVNIDIPSIAWANQFMPDVKNLQGRLSSELKLSGLLIQPQITGRVNLVNSRFSLPQTGTRIEKINLSLLSTQANKARIVGSLQSGKGTLAIDGQLDISQLEQWKAKLNLRGKQLDFMDSYEIKGVVSPNLVIDASPNAVKITGTLGIPETRIRLNDLPETAIYESSDVVIVGANQYAHHSSKQTANKNKIKTASAVGFKIHPDVRVIMGDKVSFSGFGLKTKLSGQFRIREQQQDFFAEGNVKISEGTYQAYGQKLEITQGRLVFNGPLDNPGMNIKAVRKLPQAEVGIHLTGTVQKPQTALFSTPDLSQTDKLSYLLTGRSLSETSGEDSNILLAAITSLGISGGEGIARNIGTSLGLDNVSLSSERGLKAADLELGKRLGPNLYLKYIVGLFDSMQRIAIEYQVNKRLALEAQSGINQGFDLIYKMERD